LAKLSSSKTQKKEVYTFMGSYPNPGDPNQPNQYPPNQGPAQTQYGGGYQTPPNAAPAPAPGYGDPQPPYQPGPGAYQQPPYQQGAYQQPPYQQAPYQQTPYPQRQSSIAFDWRYLTAGIGALVAFIAFFLPYYSISTGGTYLGVTIPGTVYSQSGLQIGHQVLLDIVIALVALAIAACLQFGSQMFKASATSTSSSFQKLTNSFNTNQRMWGLALLAIGAFGFFFRFILDLGSLSSWGVGSWLYTIGMIAVAVGGFFIYRPLTSTPAGVPPVPPVR
jgi:hypothetical protein